MNTREALEQGLSKQLRELYEERARLLRNLYYINSKIRELKEAEDMEKEARITTTPMSNVVYFAPTREDVEVWSYNSRAPGKDWDTWTPVETKGYGGLVKDKPEHTAIVEDCSLQPLCPKVVKLLEERKKYITSISPELR